VRILAYEHFSALGAAAPPDLRAEGGAMLAALATDLARAGHEVWTILGPGPVSPVLRLLRKAGIRVMPVPPGVPTDASSPASKTFGPNGFLGRETFQEALADVEAAWIVAPESGGCLESLAVATLAGGKRLLGTSAAAIRLAASKLRTASRLRDAGLPVVPTLEMPGPSLPPEAAGWRFPLVVKPDDGVGCEGVGLAGAELEPAWRRARRHSASVVVQPYLEGVAASVSVLVAAGGRAFPLALQGQDVNVGPEFSYRGGEVPLGSLEADRARDAARAACAAVGGLAGLVGVDLVLTPAGPVVLEINPRLTTSYVGLRRITRENLATLALRALEGDLPERVVWEGGVRFTSSGAVTEHRVPVPRRSAG
jgi:predicted ATP-grasp superfamily ATP-dependent carboligase